jgi:adenylate cyclase
LFTGAATAVETLKQYYRPLIVAGCCLAAGVLSFLLSGESKLDGTLFDIMVAQRAWIDPEPAESKPVAIVALDERSLRSDELSAFPRVFLAPQWAKMLDILFAADVKAVGFDILFVWSPEQISPGLDKPFKQALGKYHDRVVIGQTANNVPIPAYFFSIRAGKDPDAVANLDVDTDPDGVIRHVYPLIQTVKGPAKSLAAALYSRAKGEGELSPVLIAPRQKLEKMPTYAMIDVLRCGDRDPAKVAEVLGGKIVLVGTTLPDEDRKISSDRFIPNGPNVTEPDPPEDVCSLKPIGLSDPHATTIPGVFVHAAALQEILTKDSPAIAGLPWIIALSAAIGAAISGFGLVLPVQRAVIMVGLTMFALYVLSSALLIFNIWLPISLLMTVTAGAMFVAYIARYLIEDRRRRRIQRAFGHYLAPGLVARMADDDSNLRLGGEEREITIMFADLSGFTALSAKLSAEELMATTNRYLSLIAGAVDATGGYVDKFIGDAVMAFWNAPALDPEHALHGVTAGLDAATRIKAQRLEDEAAGLPGFAVKIGINTGVAIIGNVGAEGRFNYTAVGEAVNIAARLESVPGDYKCSVVIGPQTARAVGSEIVMHEVDLIRVKGKVEPVGVFRPLGRVGDIDPQSAAFKSEFDTALDLFRHRQFTEAEQAWTAAVERFPSDITGPAEIMAKRANDFASDPPEADWDGVWTKQTK